MCKVTIKAYYQHFVGIYGAIAATIGGLPVLSQVLPEDWAQFVFPPLGAWSSFYRITALIFAAAVTLAVYFGKDKPFVVSKRGRTKSIRLRIAIALLGAISFFILTQMFVLSLAIPSLDETVVVSVGYQRTHFAHANFPHASDQEMLRARGATEEEIWRLWTPGSIILVRSGLYISYFLFVLAGVACFSLGVLFDKCGAPESP